MTEEFSINNEQMGREYGSCVRKRDSLRMPYQKFFP